MNERSIDKVMDHVNSLDIPEANKEWIRKFIDYCKAQGLSRRRIIKYAYSLGKVSQLLGKDFAEANKEDIVRVVGQIESSDLKEWTKVGYKVIIKRFYKWLREYQGMKLSRRQYPDEVEWIPTTMKRSRIKLHSEILTVEEVNKIADHTLNPRDRALVLTLYESGARIGELLNLKIKDVQFDDYGAVLHLFGKTGARRIRVVSSAPAITNWLRYHPKKDDREAYLFCELSPGREGKPLIYEVVSKMLKKAAERAGVKKPVNPHNFRHSRATHLAKHLTESQLCHYMGWVQGSREASTYVHLSGRDLDDAILKLHGLKQEEEKEEEKFKPRRCPRCYQMNDPASKFCAYCGLPLDEKVIAETLDIGFAIESSKELKEMLGNVLIEALRRQGITMDQIIKEAQSLLKADSQAEKPS